MGNKNQSNELKRWQAQCLAASLAQQCRQRDEQSQHAGNGGYDGTIKQRTLSAVLADKTALLNESLSLVGYLKTIFALFKIAFCRKKRQGFRNVVWCIVEEDSLLDTAGRNA